MKKNYLEALEEARSYGYMFDDCYFDCIDSLAFVVYLPHDNEIVIPYEH